MYVLGYTCMCTVRACCVCVLSGPGLTFIVYPEALAMLPGSAIWSAVFFLTLFVMGLDTQVSLLLYAARRACLSVGFFTTIR